MELKKPILAIGLIIMCFLSTAVYAASDVNLSIIRVNKGQGGQNNALVWIDDGDKEDLSKESSKIIITKKDNSEVVVKPTLTGSSDVDYVVFFEQQDIPEAAVQNLEALMDGLRDNDRIYFYTNNEDFNKKFNGSIRYSASDIVEALRKNAQKPAAGNKKYTDILKQQKPFKDKDSETRAIFVIRLTNSQNASSNPYEAMIGKEVLVRDTILNDNGFDADQAVLKGREFFMLDFNYNLKDAKAVTLQYAGKRSSEFNIAVPENSEKINSKDKSRAGLLSGISDFFRSSIILAIAVIAVLIILAVLILIFSRKSKTKNNMLPTTKKLSPVTVEAPAPLPPLSFGNAQNIGKREDQQDSFAISDCHDERLVKEKGVFAIVADGMGGLDNGKESSSLVVEASMSYFTEKAFISEIPIELRNMIANANSELLSFLSRNRSSKSGSTVVSVIVKGSELYWISVGDSRIYLYRSQRLYKLNSEHVYGNELFQKAIDGEISFEEALNDPDRKALTSYMGIKELTEIDQNIKPFKLLPGDKILLCSDGIYGSLDEAEMTEAMKKDAQDAAYELEQRVLEKDIKGQDNMTAVVIGYNSAFN